MAERLDDDTPHYEEAPFERSARYWKKAATSYHQACTSEAPEVRKFYMELAMVWASLATELERAPPQDGHGLLTREEFESFQEIAKELLAKEIPPEHAKKLLNLDLITKRGFEFVLTEEGQRRLAEKQ